MNMDPREDKKGKVNLYIGTNKHENDKMYENKLLAYCLFHAQVSYLAVT